MKTKEELNILKEEVNTLSAKLRELTDDELSEVTGGSFSGFIGAVFGDPRWAPYTDVGASIQNVIGDWQNAAHGGLQLGFVNTIEAVGIGTPKEPEKPTTAK